MKIENLYGSRLPLDRYQSETAAEEYCRKLNRQIVRSKVVGNTSDLEPIECTYSCQEVPGSAEGTLGSPEIRIAEEVEILE
jgi:hypothetical protein